ncbi:MBL fold metallo-hydrolase [Wenyingzhuangia sp. IMCC45533]
MKKLFCVLLILISTSCSYKTVYYTDGTVHLKKGSGNVYLLKNNNQYLMIDSGKPNTARKIEKTLLKSNISPNSISHLVLTHAHYDHAGNAKYFQDKYGTKIIVGKKDLPIVHKNGLDTHLCGRGLIGKIGQKNVERQTYATFVPDILIDKEFDLKSIGFNGKIIPISGHTEGSVIVIQQTKAFVGDMIRGNVFRNSIPERHFFMCDIIDNNKDIQYVSQLSNLQTWYLGHYGPLKNSDVIEFLKD